MKNSKTRESRREQRDFVFFLSLYIPNHTNKHVNVAMHSNAYICSLQIEHTRELMVCFCFIFEKHAIVDS